MMTNVIELAWTVRQSISRQINFHEIQSVRFRSSSRLYVLASSSGWYVISCSHLIIISLDRFGLVWMLNVLIMAGKNPGARENPPSQTSMEQLWLLTEKRVPRRRFKPTVRQSSQASGYRCCILTQSVPVRTVSNKNVFVQAHNQKYKSNKCKQTHGHTHKHTRLILSC